MMQVAGKAGDQPAACGDCWADAPARTHNRQSTQPH